MNLKVVILTASDEALFNSDKAKLLHPLAGCPILTHALGLARELTTEPPVLIVNPGYSDEYKNITGENITCITIHGGALSRNYEEDFETLCGIPETEILLLHADAPLVQLESIHRLIELHTKVVQDITFLANESGDHKTIHKTQLNCLLLNIPHSQFSYPAFLIPVY